MFANHAMRFVTGETNFGTPLVFLTRWCMGHRPDTAEDWIFRPKHLSSQGFSKPQWRLTQKHKTPGSTMTAFMITSCNACSIGASARMNLLLGDGLLQFQTHQAPHINLRACALIQHSEDLPRNNARTQRGYKRASRAPVRPQRSAGQLITHSM